MEAPWGIIACHQDLVLCLGHVIQPCTLPFAYGNNGAVNRHEEIADRICG